MRLLRPVALLVLAALVAACSSGGAAAGWTFTPTKAPAGPSASAAASGGAASAAPESGAPSASAAPSSGASGGGAGASISLTAQNISFKETSLSAPASKAFTIAFTNDDAGVPHNVVIKSSSGQQLFSGDLLTGPGSKTYSVPALSPGTYQFFCAVHPQMTGTLTAK